MYRFDNFVRLRIGLPGLKCDHQMWESLKRVKVLERGVYRGRGDEIDFRLEEKMNKVNLRIEDEPGMQQLLQLYFLVHFEYKMYHGNTASDALSVEAIFLTIFWGIFSSCD